MNVVIPEVESTAVLEETLIEGPTTNAYWSVITSGSPAVLAIAI